jgi:hypothetical protein
MALGRWYARKLTELLGTGPSPEQAIRERGQEIRAALGGGGAITITHAFFDDRWFELVDGKWVER